MSDLVPEERVHAVLERADILDVLADYLPLDRDAERCVKCCCPFHEEQMPSFVVSQARQLFFCFGCQQRGNVFAFLMAHEGLTFPEAVELLAWRYGLEAEP